MTLKKIIFYLAALTAIILAGIYLFSNNVPTSANPIDAMFDNEKIVLNIIGKTGSNSGFFEDARTEFMKQNKNVEINYIGLGTFEAIDYITGDNDVDAWLSADESAVDMLRSEYSKGHEGINIISEASPIVTSPLVFVGWEERLNKLGDIDIKMLNNMVSGGKSWNELGGDPNWGFFNFSHTNPIDSNSGMQFITLLIYDYYNQIGMSKKELKVEDITNNNVMEYIKAFEKNTAKQIDGSGKFIDTMIQFGPSKYDMGVIYEYYALANIKNAQGRWGRLKVIYPNPTIWSNRPFIILNRQPSNSKKLLALKKIRDFLLSDDIQKKAMQEGYRPASTAISDLSYMEKEFGQFGFRKDISSSVPTPSIEVIESIRNLIKRVM